MISVIRTFANRHFRLGLSASAAALLGFVTLVAGCAGGSSGGGPPTLQSVTVATTTASIAAGATSQFTATGKYSNGTSQDVTATANWTSATTSVATISNTSGSIGLATGVSAGTSVITATLSGVSGTSTLTVTPATLVSLAITPTNPTIAPHTTLPFMATGTYTDKSTKDITTTVVWASSEPAIATIGASTGIVNSLTTGTTSINAVSGTIQSNPVTLTVSSQLFAYATNFGDGTVSQYSVGANGALTPLGTPTVTLSFQPFAITVEPTGQYAYVADYGSDLVSELTIGSNGELTVIGTVPTGDNSKPNGITIDHSDRFAYTANLGNGTISQYTISTAGALTPMATPTVPSGSNPSVITIDPSNRYAYVANFGTADTNMPPAGPSTIYQYAVGTDGSLTALSTPTVPSGSGPNSIVVTPNDQYVYAVNVGDGTVSQYSIGSGGALSPLTPATVPTGASAGSRPFGMTLDPKGLYAYVANSTDGTISQYTIGTGGVLVPMTPATVPAGNGVSSVSVDPTGSYLYATNRNPSNNTSASTVSQYTIGSNGALTPMTAPTVPAGINPTAVAIGY